MSMLGKLLGGTPASFDAGRFYAVVKKDLFGGKLNQGQVDGMTGILKAMDEVGDKDQDTISYALATTYHEVGGTMLPIREGFGKDDAQSRSRVLALARKRGPKSNVAKYAKPVGPYLHVYYGRGYPQLTWMDNYAACSADAGVDLVQFPDAMLNPRISARVLIRGIMDGRWNGQGKGLDHYEGEDDFLSDLEAVEARRTVNVLDKAKLIAGYHRKFYNALTAGGWK